VNRRLAWASRGVKIDPHVAAGLFDIHLAEGRGHGLRRGVLARECDGMPLPSLVLLDVLSNQR